MVLSSKVCPNSSIGNGSEYIFVCLLYGFVIDSLSIYPCWYNLTELTMLLVIFGKSLLASAEPLIFLAKTERIFSSLPLIDLSLLFKKITFSVDALI